MAPGDRLCESCPVPHHASSIVSGPREETIYVVREHDKSAYLYLHVWLAYVKWMFLLLEANFLGRKRSTAYAANDDIVELLSNRAYEQCAFSDIREQFMSWDLSFLVHAWQDEWRTEYSVWWMANGDTSDTKCCPKAIEIAMAISIHPFQYVAHKLWPQFQYFYLGANGRNHITPDQGSTIQYPVIPEFRFKFLVQNSVQQSPVVLLHYNTLYYTILYNFNFIILLDDKVEGFNSKGLPLHH